jgi:metal-responsive CopG/Arc/MetJ family transcriptional regulator
MPGGELVPQQKGYSTLHVPNELLAEIDRYIQANRWGYKSRPEVVKAAVRDFLDRESSRSS